MKKSTLAVFAGFVLWGVLPVFWKLLSSVNAVYTLCSRIIWSLVVSFIAVAALGQWEKAVEALKDKAVRRRLLASGLLVSFNWGAYIWCVTHGRVLDCSLAYYINPIFAIVIGYFAFREKLSVLQWCSVGLAVIGVAYPALANGQAPVLAVLIAMSFAAYGAVKKKVDLPGEITTFIETLFVSPLALTVILYMETQGTGALAAGQLPGWRLLLLPAAGLVTYLPLLLYSHGIRRTPLSLSGILMYINPTLQFCLGILLYKETLSRTMLVTFCIVIAAVILFVAGGGKTEKSEQALEAEGV